MAGTRKMPRKGKCIAETLLLLVILITRKHGVSHK